MHVNQSCSVWLCIYNIYWWMLDFTHTFVLYSRKTLMSLVIGMFSLFLVPSSAAQIDCCVTGLTGLNLQNSFAKFTWQFGKCEWSVDTQLISVGINKENDSWYCIFHCYCLLKLSWHERKVKNSTCHKVNTNEAPHGTGWHMLWSTPSWTLQAISDQEQARQHWKPFD